MEDDVPKVVHPTVQKVAWESAQRPEGLWPATWREEFALTTHGGNIRSKSALPHADLLQRQYLVNLW
jgi:hypothetical protein